MAITLGDRIRMLRDAKGWSQEQLAQKAHISRSVIATIENRTATRPSGDRILKIAYAFEMSVEGLYEGTQYQVPSRATNRSDTPEEILERLRLAQPVSIPVYGKFHAGSVHDEPLEYVYWSPGRKAKKNIEAYIVHGKCMEPEISDGNIVIVDRDLPGEVGDIVLCLMDGELMIGRLRADEAGEYFLQNNDEKVRLGGCQATAVVIEVIKRLK